MKTQNSILLMLLGTTASMAQSNKGFEVVQDGRIQGLVEQHAAFNNDNKGKYPGYRVQLHFGQDKAKANDIKTKFSTAYTTVPSYLTWDSPYFKVRVGNYRSYLDAYRFLKSISLEYPECFIIQEDIELPPLDEPIIIEGETK